VRDLLFALPSEEGEPIPSDRIGANETFPWNCPS
jgi:hypothetical protein